MSCSFSSGKSYSFGLPCMPFINCCQFMCLVISLLVLRAGCEKYGMYVLMIRSKMKGLLCPQYFLHYNNMGENVRQSQVYTCNFNVNCQLVVLRLKSKIFQSCRDGAIASWVINQYFRGVKCLAQGHNTAAVGFEPRTSRSGVRHSTTEPPRSLVNCQVWPEFEQTCLRFYASWFPIIYASMGDFSCHGNQSFNPICPMTYSSLSPTPVMLHTCLKFDKN